VDRASVYRDRHMNALGGGKATGQKCDFPRAGGAGAECLFGDESRSNHKQFLVRRVAWRLQAIDEGDLSERARQRALNLAQDADLRLTAPRYSHLRPQARSGDIEIHACPRPALCSPAIREKRSRFTYWRKASDTRIVYIGHSAPLRARSAVHSGMVFCSSDLIFRRRLNDEEGV